MMRTAILEQFEALLKSEGLSDPAWILRLDEFDEPPLFTRVDQVEFLRALDVEERCLAALEMVLLEIDKIAAVAAAASKQQFFVCATLSDFDMWRRGEQLLPLPAMYVNPCEQAAPEATFRLVEAYSADGEKVKGWLSQLGPDFRKFVVGEPPPGSDPDLHRVYVGWGVEPAKNIRSVGSDIGP